MVNCSICHKSFSSPSNLRKHIKIFHPSEQTELNKLYHKNSKQFKFTCDCGKNFNHKHHFKAHQKIHSSPSSINKSVKKKCPLCDYSRLNKLKMLSHFKDTHFINIVSRKLEFSTLEEFLNWKADVENKTYSRYLRNSKYKISNNSESHETVYYCCHRSGSYIPKGKGIRQLKSKGSNKINAYCPASIQLEKNNNGNCNILFIETHIGHEAEVERIQLSDSERKDLAIKIEAGIPYDEIIDEVKQSADPVDIKRIHLLTKKDLHNIQICLKRHSTAITKTNSTNENINLEENSGTPNFIEPEHSKTNKNTMMTINNAQNQENKKKYLEEKKELVKAEFVAHLNKINSLEDLENFRTMINSFSNHNKMNEISCFKINLEAIQHNKNIVTPKEEYF